MALNSTPITWVAGPPAVTAAMMNTEVRDPLTGIQAAWTNDARASSVIWTAATTNPVLSNGAIVSRYMQVGKTITWDCRITMGSTTTFGTGGWRLTLPFGYAITYLVGGVCRGYDSSLSAATGWTFSTDAVGGGVLNIMCPPTTQPNADRVVTGTVPFAWATGDILMVVAQFEAS